MRASWRIFVVGVLVLSLAAGPAAARSPALEDRDDSDGFLDVASVHQGLTEAGRLRHRVTMFEPWQDRQLERRAYLSLYFQIPDGSNRHLSIVYDDGRLKGRMYERVDGEGRPVGWVRVRRPDRRSVVISFPVGMLGSHVDTYRYSVHTLTHDEGTPATPTVPHGDPEMHWDRAPDEGAVRHRLGEDE